MRSVVLELLLAQSERGVADVAFRATKQRIARDGSKGPSLPGSSTLPGRCARGCAQQGKWRSRF